MYKINKYYKNSRWLVNYYSNKKKYGTENRLLFWYYFFGFAKCSRRVYIIFWARWTRQIEAADICCKWPVIILQIIVWILWPVKNITHWCGLMKKVSEGKNIEKIETLNLRVWKKIFRDIFVFQHFSLKFEILLNFKNYKKTWCYQNLSSTKIW